MNKADKNVDLLKKKGKLSLLALRKVKQKNAHPILLMQAQKTLEKLRPCSAQSFQRAYSELLQLRTGIVDTSTLIYLERLELNALASKHLRFLLIPGVVTEFGSHPSGMHLIQATDSQSTDAALLETAMKQGLPLFSDDGGLLRKARAKQHPHYNTLMLLLALRAQKVLNAPQCADLQARLLTFARYSGAVCTYAADVSACIEEKLSG